VNSKPSGQLLLADTWRVPDKAQDPGICGDKFQRRKPLGEFRGSMTANLGK
jgi:hypothetical protein